MRTSVGIWAFGNMATRFDAAGYKPELTGKSTAGKVRTAVEGLGDLIDDYEFRYPQELSPANLDRSLRRGSTPSATPFPGPGTRQPYLQGERTLHADPDARGALVGLTSATIVARSSARPSRASRSQPPCSASRSSVPRSRRARPNGAALLGGVKQGVFADVHEAVAACIRVRERIDPAPDWQAVYEDGYARYRELYPTLRRIG